MRWDGTHSTTFAKHKLEFEYKTKFEIEKQVEFTEDIA